MADVNKDVITKETATSTIKTTVNEEKFSVEEYMENAKALGYTKIVLAGAFSNCSKEEEFTKIDVDKMVKNFLGKKVK